MVRPLSILLICSLIFASRAPAQSFPPLVWPTAQWRESSPEAQGLSSADLADALEFARTRQINVHSLTVIRNGVIVLDAYFHPFVRDQRHDVASVTKSVVSMLTGVAIDNGDIADGPEHSVSALSPLLGRDVGGAAAQIRVEDLLAMRSGLERPLGAVRACM